MRDIYLMVQMAGVTFLCLTIAMTSSASKREELERAAELAVERAAERVAEAAVEKALETGNSSTETETIRASHSRIRKYDFTQQLPSYTILTPEERDDMLRMEKEKEAAELAVQQIKHSLFRRQTDDFGPDGDDDFDDDGPGFDDVSPGFGDDAKGDDVGLGFGGLGRLPFGGLGSFGKGSGDFTSGRFTRQYPYGNPYVNPYQHTHYQFVPVNQEARGKEQAAKAVEKPVEEKKEEEPQVVPTIKHHIPAVRIYQVETKPVYYHAPPTNQYAPPFYYYQPQVKIFNQGAEAQPEAPTKEKRERRGPFF